MTGTARPRVAEDMCLLAGDGHRLGNLGFLEFLGRDEYRS